MSGMSKIYEDGTYLKNNPTWGEEEAYWKAQVVFNLLSKNNLHPESICEVGCGAGGVLVALSSMLDSVVDMYGYDISPQAISLCNEKKMII